MLEKMRKDIDEMDWELNLEREEHKMRMKLNNEFIDYTGFCDDWDNDLHPT